MQDLEGLLEKLRRSKNNTEKNRIQVGFINGGLRNLKEEIEDMSEQEKQIENADEIGHFEIVHVLKLNRQQQGQGLKILTPS